MLKNLKSIFLKLCVQFNNAKCGIVSIEFALIFPIFLIIMYTVVEFSNYNLNKRRAQFAVDFAVEFLSRDDDNTLSTIERMNALDIWLLVNTTANLAPNANSNSRGGRGFSRSFAGIEFNKIDPSCNGNTCKFTPNVNWTFSWIPRAAGVEAPITISCSLNVVSNDTRLDGTNIAQGSVGRSAAIMGAYVTRYRPILQNPFIPEQDIVVTALRKLRSDIALQHLPQFQC